MQTFGDMKERLIDDLMVSASSTLFTDDRIEKLIQDAYMWATSLYSWPQLERGRDTTLPAVSSSGDQYFDYPEDFRTDTLTEFIRVNGKSHKKKGWNDFLEHIRLNSSSTKRVFADYGRQIFVYPHGTQGVTVSLWGQVQATQLSSDSDETIFSKHDESGNEAVVRKALSSALRRFDPQLSAEEERAAITLLSVIWKKVQDRQQYAQPLSKQMFNVPNFLAGNNSGYIARNFATDFFEED